MSALDLSVYLALDPAERRAVATRILAGLGGAWSLLDEPVGPRALPAARHTPTGRTFVLVPGTTFEMGLRDSDMQALADEVDWTLTLSKHVEDLLRLARPVRRVDVPPFLCDRQTLRRADIIRLTGRSEALETVTRDRAIALAEGLGLRLPSEAELELLARGGGELAFVDDGARVWRETGRWPTEGPLGIEDLSLGEWAGDDFHPHYEGAPLTSRAWMEGEACGVFRGELPIGPDRDRSELFLALAARRGRGARPGEQGSEHRALPFRLAMSVDAPSL